MSSQKACRELEPLLSASFDHEATAEEMAIVERHTRTCAACAARLNQYTTLVPRLEANIRAGLFEAELAGGRAKRRSPPGGRPWPSSADVGPATCSDPLPFANSGRGRFRSASPADGAEAPRARGAKAPPVVGRNDSYHSGASERPSPGRFPRAASRLVPARRGGAPRPGVSARAVLARRTCFRQPRRRSALRPARPADLEAVLRRGVLPLTP